MKRVRSSNLKDREKFEKIYLEKINFFEHLNFKNLLIWEDGLIGYYGFTYDNYSMTSDKVYGNIEKKLKD